MVDLSCLRFVLPCCGIWLVISGIASIFVWSWLVAAKKGDEMMSRFLEDM